ncbi:MAG TPA: hypothetical protein ENG77_06725 [Chromatiales bacterium]|nr:hypothetical protein [Chromatiales bacterium]
MSDLSVETVDGIVEYTRLAADREDSDRTRLTEALDRRWRKDEDDGPAPPGFRRKKSEENPDRPRFTVVAPLETAVCPHQSVRLFVPNIPANGAGA